MVVPTSQLRCQTAKVDYAGIKRVLVIANSLRMTEAQLAIDIPSPTGY